MYLILGRTAEFTSKIITALHAHAMAGRLTSALEKLPVIDASSRSLLLKQVSLRERIKQPPHLEASTTQQLTHSSCKKRPFVETESTVGAYKHNMCHDFRVVIWLPILHTDITVDLDLRERFHGIVQLLVCTLWRSRLAKEQQQKVQSNLSKEDKNNLGAAEEDKEVPLRCGMLYVGYVETNIDGTSLQTHLVPERATILSATQSYYYVL